MKTKLTILALIALAALFSCSKSDGGKGSGKLDPNAKISIKPAKSSQSVASKAEYLSPVEVVRLTTDIAFQSHDYPKEPYCNVGISDEQKDLITPKIMMWGEQIIRNSELNPFFIEAYDVVLVTRPNQDKSLPISDTLAYIPNAQLSAAATTIKAAYAKQNYDEVYRLFDQAYQFTPINGADWRALKANGEN